MKLLHGQEPYGSHYVIISPHGHIETWVSVDSFSGVYFPFLDILST